MYEESGWSWTVNKFSVYCTCVFFGSEIDRTADVRSKLIWIRHFARRNTIRRHCWRTRDVLNDFQRQGEKGHHQPRRILHSGNLRSSKVHEGRRGLSRITRNATGRLRRNAIASSADRGPFAPRSRVQEHSLRIRRLSRLATNGVPLYVGTDNTKISVHRRVVFRKHGGSRNRCRN